MGGVFYKPKSGTKKPVTDTGRNWPKKTHAGSITP